MTTPVPALPGYPPGQHRTARIGRPVLPPLVSNPAPNTDSIPPDAENVAVIDMMGTHRNCIDSDALAATQVDNPEPSRGPQQAGVKRGNTSIGQPELATLG